MRDKTWSQNQPTIDNDIVSGLSDMLKEKGNTCVSIIIPTHRVGQDRQGDQLEIQRAISTAKQAVQAEAPDLLLAMDTLFQQIDFTRNKEGVGIFISPSVRRLVQFPFPVTKKILVNRLFDLHELLYIENYAIVYYLLRISEKEIHLFHGIMDQLEEVRDENFPIEIVEEYEYNKPNQANSNAGYASVKSFEKDKSVLRQIRLRNTFQRLDKLLSKYLIKENIPLVLCGPEKDISIFKSVTSHVSNIITSMSDNYKGGDTHALEVLAWSQMRSFLDEQKLKLIAEFKEKIGDKLAVFGIKDVWNAASDGKGFKLLIEKNYSEPGFVTQDNNLYLKRPKENHVEHHDVVNEIVATILRKNGKVIIVEDDVLKEYNRIALILRY